MSSRFFDQLVNDRRDGIAPPQLEQLRQAEPEEDEEDDEQPPPVTFSASAAHGYDCSRCGAVVTSNLTPLHIAWHEFNGA